MKMIHRSLNLDISVSSAASTQSQKPIDEF